MPVSLPVPTQNPGDPILSSRWNSYVRDNINKLLSLQHRVLTVAQFAALTGLEGTKGTVAPDEVYLEVDSTNGVQWHLAYESGEPTYKWRFLGGPPLVSQVATAEGTTSGTYAALATAGPSVTVPRAGDYDVEHGSLITDDGGNRVPVHSFDVGGTGALDADCVRAQTGTGGTSVGRRNRKTAIAASAALVSKYKTSGSVAGTFANRFMAVTPVRLI